MTFKTPAEVHCTGKYAFPDYTSAYSTIKKKRDVALQPYKCPTCGFFHVGHATPKKVNYQRARDDRKLQGDYK